MICFSSKVDIQIMIKPYKILNRFLKSLAFRIYLIPFRTSKFFLRCYLGAPLRGDIVIVKFPNRKYHAISVVTKSNPVYFVVWHLKFIPKFNISNPDDEMLKRLEERYRELRWVSEEWISVCDKEKRLVSKKIFKNPAITLERKIELLFHIYSLDVP